MEPIPAHETGVGAHDDISNPEGWFFAFTVSKGGLAVVVPKCSVVADAVPAASSVVSSRTESALVI